MKCEVDRSRISKIVSDMSEHSREVMEKTFILATVFNSDVYLISAVKMPKVAAYEFAYSISWMNFDHNKDIDILSFSYGSITSSNTFLHKATSISIFY